MLANQIIPSFLSASKGAQDHVKPTFAMDDDGVRLNFVA
jgi:hypothetical protein